MATAAQLAKRKIAAPKSRINRSSATSPAPQSNPFGGSAFGSPQPAAQPTFGNIGGGVTFGQSQSFPPGGSDSASGFNFSVPGQSTSFTFGEPVQSNPFANLNGGAPQDENKPPEDTVMESPQKKPAFGSSTFGSTLTSETGGGLFGGFGGGGFGQPAENQQRSTSQSSATFGQLQANGFGNSPAPSLFGTAQAASSSMDQSTKPASIFGQSINAQPTPSTASTSNGLFGQSSQPSKVPTFSFGQPASEPPKPLFSLGQSTSQSPTTEPAKAPTFSFGQPSPSQSKTDPPKFLFGQTTASPQTATSSTPAVTAPSVSSIFGQPQSVPATTMPSFFGSANPTTPPVKPDLVQAKPTPLFGSSSASIPSSTVPAPPSNPFAGLFAESSKESSPTPDLEIPKSMFNFAAPAAPKGLFGSPSSTEIQPSPQKRDETSSSLFGLKPTESPQASTLFSPPKFGSGSQQATPLFGQNDSSSAVSSDQSAKTPIKSTPTFSFGQASAPKSAPPAETRHTSGFTFGTPTPAASQTTTNTPATSSKRPAPAPIQKALEETSVTSQNMAKEIPSTAHSAPTTPVSSTTSPPEKAAINAEEPKRTVYTNPPARIPPYLNAESYRSYDSNYRLHSLNREFQKRIACIDPTREDMENIVRTYVAARESIGESIGLYTRNIAGMKRKEDHMDDDDDRSNTVKKARTGNTADAQNSPSKLAFGDSIFQPVPSSTMSTPTGNPNNTNSSVTPATKSAAHGPHSASSIFKSMIPESSASNSSNTNFAANSCSGLNASRATTSTAGFKPATNAASLSPSKSAKKTTTPPSSPPKKVGFKPSGFSAPSATDFMSAFKKQSEANVAKFEREAMEKRKAEDFDSDEDDEEQWMKKYEEEQRAKKAKLGAFRGFTPSFENSDASDDNAQPKMFGQVPKPAANTSSDDAPSQDDDDDEDSETGAAQAVGDDDDDDGDDEDDDDEDESLNAQPLITNGKSIFDRISKAPDTMRNGTPQSEQISAPKNFFGQSLNATPETPSFSPITPSSTYKPASNFNFTPTPRESPTPAVGASVFDGGFTKNGPIPGEGLFGSRSNTPVNGESSTTSIFGNLGTSQNAAGDDHTWKKGSGIKFGQDTQAPSVSVTAPSPMKEAPKFNSLFGTGANATGAATGTTSLGFGFGNSTSAPAPGFLGAASHLAPGSGTTSGFSSRATSPGVTDNESVATNETDDAQNDPQSHLLAHSGPYPGEENEDILFEIRAKIFRNYGEDETQGTKKQKGWNLEGLGPMRVLKDKTSNKTRIVARAEPNANVVLNTNLIAGVSYKASDNSIVVPVFGSGPPVQWLMKVKKPENASELAAILEANKS